MFNLPDCYRRTGVAAAVAAFAAVCAPAATAQDLPAISPPVFVTSLGQSLDAFQLQLATRRTGAEVIYDPLADIDQLAGMGVLFLGVGASLKGFGEAGISIVDERERARRFLDEAEALDIPIIVFHLGGQERRDDLTNQLIEVTAPSATALFVRSDGNEDGLFTSIAEANGIPLVLVEGIVQLVPHLQQMLVPN